MTQPLAFKAVPGREVFAPCGACANCQRNAADKEMVAWQRQNGGGAELLGRERPCLRVLEDHEREAAAK